MHLYWKSETEIVFISRWHDCAYRKSNGICKKLRKSELNTVSEWKTNIQNDMCFHLLSKKNEK